MPLATHIGASFSRMADVTVSADNIVCQINASWKILQSEVILLKNPRKRFGTPGKHVCPHLVK
ncbi:hypothetical protein VDQ74_11345 [Xanthomonas campestris pv. campestris]|nr:hypothetical protein [Xanthomonas campestris pv. campestris]